jgi:hypothetical protein
MSENTTRIRYWEPSTGGAWLPEQWERFDDDRKGSCIAIADKFWLSLISRNSAGDGYIANDPETNLPTIIPYPGSTREELLDREMLDLKRYLSETDYAVIKCNELGLSFATEYPEMAQRRAEARVRINEIEALLSEAA